MLSNVMKKAPGWLWTVLAFAALANKDRENFFPLSSHSDLRFQIIGESVEILALMGIFALAPQWFRQAEETSASGTHRTRLAIFTGAIFAAFLFVSFWRDYFPNDTFNFGEALKDVGYSSIVVVVIALFSLIPPAKKGKTREEESGSGV